MNSAERVENKRKEGGTQWLNGDILQVFGDFVLGCVAHWKADIFQGTGVEIQFLDWRNDSDISEEQFVELLDEIEAGEDKIPGCTWHLSGRDLGDLALRARITQ